MSAPSYDPATLAAYFRPVSAELFRDPIVGPVLARLEHDGRNRPRRPAPDARLHRSHAPRLDHRGVSLVRQALSPDERCSYRDELVSASKQSVFSSDHPDCTRDDPSSCPEHPDS